MFESHQITNSVSEVPLYKLPPPQMVADQSDTHLRQDGHRGATVLPIAAAYRAVATAPRGIAPLSASRKLRAEDRV